MLFQLLTSSVHRFEIMIKVGVRRNDDPVHHDMRKFFQKILSIFVNVGQFTADDLYASYYGFLNLLIVDDARIHQYALDILQGVI